MKVCFGGNEDGQSDVPDNLAEVVAVSSGGEPRASNNLDFPSMLGAYLHGFNGLVGSCTGFNTLALAPQGPTIWELGPLRALKDLVAIWVLRGLGTGTIAGVS